jgi:hypothetical protein
MKKSLLALAALCVSAPAFAQQLDIPALSPGAMVKQTAGLTDITVEYSSPGVRGRKIFGNVVPYGQVWRAGANSATKITFSKDVKIGDTKVPAGEYALFVIPEKAPQPWTVILNKDTKQWGAFSYKKEEDFLRIQVKPVTIAEQERLTYNFPDFNNDEATLAIQWDRVKLPVKIKLGTAQQAEAAIKNLQENPQMALTRAARYELEQAKNYDLGLKLVDESIKTQEDWLNTWTKAQLVAAKGNKKEALALAEKADQLGSKNPPRYFYAAEVKKAISEWKSAK